MKNVLGLAVVSLLLGCSANVDPVESDPAGPDENLGQASSAYVNASFTVKSFANKCVDVGGDAYQAVGSPVYIYSCNGSTAQSLRAVELTDGSYDFRLVTNRGFCLGVSGGSVAVGRALVLQTCVNAPAAIPPTQRFGFDGDTLFVGAQTSSGSIARDLVVEVLRGRGANRTPLVVGTREVDPAEDFRFVPVNPNVLHPHSGFRRVRNLGELDAALGEATLPGKPGRVIELAPNTSIRIDNVDWRFLKAGTTLRGNRRGMTDGPEIFRANTQEGALFKVDGDNVRVTGLRLRGFSTSKADNLPGLNGLLVENLQHRVLVDHNELSAFTSAAVDVRGPNETNRLDGCYYQGDPPVRNTRVVANWIHDNSRQNLGYGVMSEDGGNVLIDGNTFARNRHAIAADSNGKTSYTATFNLVTESNTYCNFWVCWKEHDFDVHGSGAEYEGGPGGFDFEIRSNTFFPNLGKNVNLRGYPCNQATIVDNAYYNNPTSLWLDTAGGNLTVARNQFYPELTTTAPGDFDGDGVQDDFIGTGTAWYYRPGRTKEWRLLNRYNERHMQLTFGDFDGDGRTDVRVVDAQGRTVTSWGGSSPWDDGSNGSVIGTPVFGGSPTDIAPR